MDWAVTILSIISMWLLGEKKKSGWLYKLASQLAWGVLAVQKQLWGFIPLAVLTGMIAGINYYKWSKGDFK